MDHARQDNKKSNRATVVCILLSLGLVGVIAFLVFRTPKPAVYLMGGHEPPKDDDKSFFTITPTGFTHTALDPLKADDKGVWTMEYRDSWSGGRVECDFDIFMGSHMGGADGAGIARTKYGGGAVEDRTYGYDLQVTAGYAIASGKYPLLSGRRVRGASDGTQFAIEELSTMNGETETVTERVYFLTRGTSEKLYVRIYADETRKNQSDVQTLEEPGEVLEVTWSRTGTTLSPVSAVTKKLSEKHPAETQDIFNQRVYFAAQMFVLLYDPAIPQEDSHGKSATGEVAATGQSPLPKVSLMTRFVERYEPGYKRRK